MPGNIQNATPPGIMPCALCISFSESREHGQLQAQYHDGTTERLQLAQTSRKTFKLVQRLAAVRGAALKAFWDGQRCLSPSGSGLSAVWGSGTELSASFRIARHSLRTR